MWWELLRSRFPANFTVMKKPKKPKRHLNNPCYSPRNCDGIWTPGLLGTRCCSRSSQWFPRWLSPCPTLNHCFGCRVSPVGCDKSNTTGRAGTSFAGAATDPKPTRIVCHWQRSPASTPLHSALCVRGLGEPLVVPGTSTCGMLRYRELYLRDARVPGTSTCGNVRYRVLVPAGCSGTGY